MIRLVKRYGSRKLYDTEESRYVHLEELAVWIRQGQELKVVDNTTGEDVTAQTLTQIISEEGRRGRSALPESVLHEIIRFGQHAVSEGVGRLQTGVDRVVRASVDRLAPLRQAREEMEQLRRRLAELENSLQEIESTRDLQAAPARRSAAAPKRARAARSTPGKKATTNVSQE
jgi:polyhydroxyalkanoate synthesis repressor PhaR